MLMSRFRTLPLFRSWFTKIHVWLHSIIRPWLNRSWHSIIRPWLNRSWHSIIRPWPAIYISKHLLSEPRLLRENQMQDVKTDGNIYWHWSHLMFRTPCEGGHKTKKIRKVWTKQTPTKTNMNGTRWSRTSPVTLMTPVIKYYTQNPELK
jgi:hypothetical protein